MLAYAMFSDKGNRPQNEDSIYANATSKKGCFVLADGLGGQGKGDVASKFVVDMVKKMYKKKKRCRDDFITQMVNECQREMLKIKVNEDITENMMTTLVILLIEGEKISWGHVGDSRLYHFENRKLMERTMDHSVPQVLAAAGDIKESEIRHHPDRNRLLRAIGMNEQEGTMNSIREIKKESKKHTFLLCSDGFWEYIDEKHMEKTLKHAKTPEAWISKMKKIVQKNGKNFNMDNYTAIAVFLD